MHRVHLYITEQYNGVIGILGAPTVVELEGVVGAATRGEPDILLSYVIRCKVGDGVYPGFGTAFEGGFSSSCLDRAWNQGK